MKALRWRRGGGGADGEAEDGGPGKVGVVWAVGGTKIEEGEETKRDRIKRGKRRENTKRRKCWTEKCRECNREERNDEKINKGMYDGGKGRRGVE